VSTGDVMQDQLPPVLSVVGRSGVGKTVFVEKLIPELKRRGIKVGTIKHHLHDFEVDQPGKDSWRHAQAGSDTVVLASPKKLAVIKRLEEEMGIDELVQNYLGDVDLVLTEGYKTQGRQKIEVYRHDRSTSLLSPVDELFAIVADQTFDLPVPQFGLQDVKGVVDLISKRLLASHYTPTHDGC
jgi:molybdopterin-guanine dinucleotide biosynthesis protein MobB